MSHINGTGYGSSHDWENCGSIQWGIRRLPSMAACTSYKCKSCGAAFGHHYNITANIFKAIEEAGMLDICEGQAVPDLPS